MKNSQSNSFNSVKVLSTKKATTPYNGALSVNGGISIGNNAIINKDMRCKNSTVINSCKIGNKLSVLGDVHSPAFQTDTQNNSTMFDCDILPKNDECVIGNILNRWNFIGNDLNAIGNIELGINRDNDPIINIGDKKHCLEINSEVIVRTQKNKNCEFKGDKIITHLPLSIENQLVFKYEIYEITNHTQIILNGKFIILKVKNSYLDNYVIELKSNEKLLDGCFIKIIIKNNKYNKKLYFSNDKKKICDRTIYEKGSSINLLKIGGKITCFS